MESRYNDVTTHLATAAAADMFPTVSFESLRMFKIINCVILSSAIGVFGIIANVINVIIFYKRGLDNTVNISLFGIAISDLGSLITTLWMNICFNPLLEESHSPMVTSEVQYLTAGWPHVCFTRITCCITVYVTAERCTCITAPLKVKHIFTPTRTKVIICSIYLLMAVSLIPEYITGYIGWKFYPPRNETLLRLVFTSDRPKIEGLVFVLNSTLALCSFIAVIVCTVVLVWKLKVTAKWRQSSTFNLEQFHNFSVRDKKTVNMIVLIAIILIICYTPGTALLMVTFFEPEFSVSGRYVNTFIAAWTFGLLLETVNSSVNIILYYKMSTRYRQTLRQLFSVCTSRTRSPDRKNSKCYVDIKHGTYVERSDSDVMYEVSTEFCDLEASPAISNSLEALGRR